MADQPTPDNPRLKQHYAEKVAPMLKEKFGIQNDFAVPKLEKIVISMGLGKAVTGGTDGMAIPAQSLFGISPFGTLPHGKTDAASTKPAAHHLDIQG